MKVYRVLYWLGSVITEKFIRAKSEEEAKKSVEDRRIIKIEEWE